MPPPTLQRRIDASLPRGAGAVTIQGVTEECGFQALKILDWYGLSCFGLRSKG
ncbi:MAG: hypothetical protein ACO34J_04860 [Prochlorothrix sp.]